MTGVQTCSSDLDGQPADPRLHNIAFVFQEVSVIPWFTVEDNIRFGLHVKRLPHEEIERRTERMLEIVGLTRYHAYYPQQLYSFLFSVKLFYQQYFSTVFFCQRP